MPYRMPVLVTLVLTLGGVLTAIGLLIAGPTGPAGAASADVLITQLSCGSKPEYVRIKNFGSASQSLAGFRLQSDPDQDYALSEFVGNIGAGQTLEFQAGTGASDGPNRYKLTGSFIFRDDDPSDYARLVRPGSSSHQVSCGSTPTTPAPSTPSPTPQPTAAPATFGDVDCDGSVRIGDAQKIARRLIGLTISKAAGCPEIGSAAPASAASLVWGDVDCDGQVRIGDAQKLARHLIDLPVSQADDCPPIGAPI